MSYLTLWPTILFSFFYCKNLPSHFFLQCSKISTHIFTHTTAMPIAKQYPPEASSFLPKCLSLNTHQQFINHYCEKNLTVYAKGMLTGSFNVWMADYKLCLIMGALKSCNYDHQLPTMTTSYLHMTTSYLLWPPVTYYDHQLPTITTSYLLWPPVTYIWPPVTYYDHQLPTK